jgi:hypothetical protein
MGEKGRRLQVGDTQPRVLTCFNITGYKHSVRTQPDTSEYPSKNQLQPDEGGSRAITILQIRACRTATPYWGSSLFHVGSVIGEVAGGEPAMVVRSRAM